MGEVMEERLIQAKEQEWAMCGYVLLDPGVWGDVSDLTAKEHFTISGAKLIWRAFHALVERGAEIDYASVVALLRDKGKLRGRFDEQFILGLLDEKVACNPTIRGILGARQMLIEYARRRKIQYAADRLAQSCIQGGDTDVSLREFESLAYESQGPGKRASAPVSFAQSLDDTMGYLKGIWDNPETASLKTGNPGLDHKLHLDLEHLVVIAGRPAMGKSAFADWLLFELCKLHGFEGLVCNYEMNLRRELNLRRLARSTKIPMNVLKAGKFDEREHARLFASMKKLKLATKLVHDVDVSHITAGAVRAEVRRMRDMGHNVRVVLIDYLQQMHGPFKTQQDNIAHNSRALKIMAREMKLIVLCVAQLNRGVESRENKRPGMADLRGAGQIEQDMDEALFLYRDEYYNANTQMPGVAEVIIGKQRQGETGTVYMDWNGPCTLFSDRGVPRADRQDEGAW